MADLATTASSIAGLLAALAACIAIFEMRRQRRSGYRPDLVVDELDLDFTAQPGRIPKVRRHVLASAENEPPGTVLALNCLNIGVGPAKRVTAAWHFDPKTFFEAIASLRQPNGPYAFVQLGDTLRINMSDSIQIVHSLTAQLRVEVPYVLPASVRAEPYPLRLPPAFVHLVSLVVQLASARPDSGDNFPEIPLLTLSLSFHDLEGGEYTVHFRVSTHFVMFSRGVQSPEDGELLAGAVLHVARVKSLDRTRPAA